VYSHSRTKAGSNPIPKSSVDILLTSHIERSSRLPGRKYVFKEVDHVGHSGARNPGILDSHYA
jgi:hypothetical protein